MDRSITAGRLVVAVVTTSAEEAAIFVIWRRLLPAMPAAAVLSLMAVWLGFCVWLFIFVTGALKRRPAEGMMSMVGMTGLAAGPLAPDGMVKIRGELWKATSIEGNIQSGEGVEVVEEEVGLKLKVKRTTGIQNTGSSSPSMGEGR
jgi:membrane-bound ClpP family serine protease